MISAWATFPTQVRCYDDRTGYTFLQDIKTHIQCGRLLCFGYSLETFKNYAPFSLSLTVRAILSSFLFLYCDARHNYCDRTPDSPQGDPKREVYCTVLHTTSHNSKSITHRRCDSFFFHFSFILNLFRPSMHLPCHNTFFLVPSLQLPQNRTFKNPSTMATQTKLQTLGLNDVNFPRYNFDCNLACNSNISLKYVHANALTCAYILNKKT